MARLFWSFVSKQVRSRQVRSNIPAMWFNGTYNEYTWRGNISIAINGDSPSLWCHYSSTRNLLRLWAFHTLVCVRYTYAGSWPVNFIDIFTRQMDKITNDKIANKNIRPSYSTLGHKSKKIEIHIVLKPSLMTDPNKFLQYLCRWVILGQYDHHFISTDLMLVFRRYITS